MNAVTENELFLTTEYIKKRSLLPAGRVRTEGDSLICGYLNLTLDLLGSSDDNSIREIWYAVSLSRFDETALRCAIDHSLKENIPLLLIILSENIPSNSTIQKYAEMEYIATDEKLRQIRDLILSLNAGKSVKLLLCDRLFGAEFDSLSLKPIAEEAQTDHRITISQNDMSRRFSALYVPDFINAVFTVSKHGQAGNAYNASSFDCDAFEIKETVFRMIQDQGVKLVYKDTESETVSYSALSFGKLSSLGYEPVCTKEEAIRYTLSAYAKDFDIFSPFILSQYDGKLSALRELQLEMLKEFDRICRKHDIEYFLSGGSMLGAVRHQGYIPWDDDIDVAFLRENYKKFENVVRDELNDKFLYENYKNGDGYHYFFDRITAKNTYFATKYSDGYVMPKGISIDIFVFDNAPKDSYRFWKGLMNRRLLMNVRWKNTARHGKAYLLSKLLLPILRLKSMDSYSMSYDKATRKYETRETGYVLPPATDHNYKGSMPKEWFSSVIPIKFEGIDSFIPTGYDRYLKLWYGEDYLTLLPLSKRQNYHDYYRLDAGAPAISPDTEFDYRGELL
ncbi:MAG: LicD family protein [Ruminococcus sp.]|nr:LicD family protein [Ruminococcus sp.]